MSQLVEASKKKRLLDFILDIITIWVLIEISIVIENAIEHNILMQGFRVLLVLGLYYIPMEYFLGKTVGKYITKTSVVNDDGTEIDFRTTVQRYLARWIPFEFASLGMGYDAKAWHDTLTHTYVIDDVLSKNNMNPDNLDEH